MKRLAFGAAAAAGTAFALHQLAPKIRQMHAHCREMMGTRCGGTDTSCRPEQTARCV